SRGRCPPLATKSPRQSPDPKGHESHSGIRFDSAVATFRFGQDWDVWPRSDQALDRATLEHFGTSIPPAVSCLLVAFVAIAISAQPSPKSQGGSRSRSRTCSPDRDHLSSTLCCGNLRSNH